MVCSMILNVIVIINSNVNISNCEDIGNDLRSITRFVKYILFTHILHPCLLHKMFLLWFIDSLILL